MEDRFSKSLCITEIFKISWTDKRCAKEKSERTRLLRKGSDCGLSTTCRYRICEQNMEETSQIKYFLRGR